MTNMLLNNKKSNQEKEARALTQALKKEEEVFNTDISLFANMVPIPYDTHNRV